LEDDAMQRVTSAVFTGLLALLIIGTGLQPRVQAQYSRKTPITEAVEKTRNSIVTIKVEKQGNWDLKDVAGTGVIVDGRGYIITSCHVVSGAEKVAVVLADETALAAKVFAEDPGHDLAILSISTKKKLVELAIGPGADIKVGETVITVGHPFGYTNTVSTGIVSATGREIPMPDGGRLTNLIQTNAAINPGNSGGPMLNINGELIGINVALRQGAQGIAFALNGDTVQKVLSKHLSAARVAKVTHGLVCSEKIIADEGDDRQQVVVDKVVDNSPAALAGLKAGDLIERIGDRRVANRFDVERALWSHKAGDKLEATVLRGGKETILTMTLIMGEALTRVSIEGVDIAKK
jgi:serine protease Do